MARNQLVLLSVAALLAAGCSTSRTAIASSSPAAQTGLVPSATTGWVAARVEQPVTIEGQPTDAPGFCSPCHPIIGTYIGALIADRGGYLALGHDHPPSHAAAWSSTDAASWRRVTTLPAPDGSSISAAVATADEGVLAVGTDGRAAAVWRSGDGVAWSIESLPGPDGVGATDLLTAVTRTNGGYLAAGYRQSAAAVRSATFWRSSNGVTWSRVAAPLPAGSSEVTGLAAGPDGETVVAVGISGDERRGTTAAWQSLDGGESWQAIDGPSLAGGRMLAVVAGGPGFAAVGETTDQTGAVAWTSVDGSVWNPAPPQPALTNGGLQMVMNAVASEGTGVVASGWKTDAGNGSAVVWRSSDGSAWTRLPQDASFSGAGMAAILAKPRLLAAGTMGWPDTHAAQVWIAPSS